MDFYTWKGITRDQSYTSDGALYAQNTRFYIEGELQRRRGMTYQNSQSGTVMQNYLHPLTGYWNSYVTSSGDIVAVAL